MWNERKITVLSVVKLPSSTPTSCLTFATRMTKKKGKNSLSRDQNTSTQMNQVDTRTLRDLQTAGWTFVDELVRFRILQLLHTPCTSYSMSPSPVCGHLSDPVVLVHPRRFNASLHDLSIAASFLSRRIVRMARRKPLWRSYHSQCGSMIPDTENLFGTFPRLCCAAFSGPF